MAAIEWNEQTAAHLFRRAAFGATVDEIQVALRDGLDATVNRLVDYDAVQNGALDARITAMNLDLRTRDGSVRYWLTRMMFTARPLEERMALLWHQLFTASRAKVNIVLILDQIRLFRRLALAPFKELCLEVAKDAAMMNWLDNYTSRQGQPNENFGRELLELFTLGRGNYAEGDVIAATRAFTGWTLDATLFFFRFRDEWHDHGPKTFMGATGDWNGDDIIDMIASKPEHARYIATRLFAFFGYENPEPATIDRLAAVYAAHNTGVRELVRAILLSPEMYSARAIGTKIKSPIEFVAIAGRQLELQNDIPDVARFLSVQGQVPYEAPDVSGWPGGRTWIGASSLLGRMAFAERVVQEFAPRVTAQTTAASLVDDLLHRLGPLSVPASVRQQLIDYVGADGALVPRARGAAQLILSLPAAQFG